MAKRSTKIRLRLFAILLIIIVTGLLLPQKISMPVEGADKNSYNPNTFWYYPWGKSVTHKGIDIFAREGTRINSSTPGLVLWTGTNGRGGNAVLILGAKWRVHYFAHLKDISTSHFSIVNSDSKIGTVGKTGNAATTPAHLHYSIVTLLPYPWRIDGSKQGWKKMFFLNPLDYSGIRD